MAEKQNTPEIRFEGFTDPWEQRKWSEYVSISTDMVDPRSGNYDTLPHVGPGNMESFTGRLYDNVNTVKDDALISGKFHFNPGDIIYGKINPQLGKYTYAQFEGLASADAYVLNGKNGLTQEFLFGILQTKAFFDYSVSVSMRSGMPKINRDELNAFEFLAPNESEQRAIGDILLKLDDLITLHQRKHDKLCTLKKSMLDKMFPKPGETEPEIRFEGFTDPWEQRKLSEVATFGGGHTPSMADSDNYEDGCVLWVTSQDVKSSYLDRTTTQITEKGAKKLTLYPAGSLVMVTRSGILRHTLPVAELRKPSTVNQDIRVILPQDTCCGGWLLQFFISRNKELLLEFGKTGTTVESVDFGKIKDMLLRMPSSVEQQQIGRYFAQLDSLITLHQRMCPIFSFCAHGSRTNFAQTLQGWLQILRYPRPIPKMLVSPSAPASGVFGTAKGAFICASSSAGASTSSPSARKNFITSSTLCCRESLSSP